MKEHAIGIHLASAALFAGAAAWALQQQGGYVIASWACGYDIGSIWSLTLAALLIVGAGGWLSWRALQPLLSDTGVRDSDLWRPRRFLSMVALMAAFLFLFAILMQAAAALFLPGCTG